MPASRRDRVPRPPVGSSVSEKRQWASTYRKTPYHQLPWFHRFPEPWIVRAAGEGWIPERGRVLDIGCGAGTNVLWYAHQMYDTVGVDLAPGAVQAAVKRQRADPLTTRARFTVGDALALPFRTAAFDVVSDVGCFHALPIPRRPDYVRELSRVLRPGGKALLLVFAREETMEMGPPHRPSILELAQVFEREFIFERLEYIEAHEGGPMFRNYQLLLRRRAEPQPPAR